MTAGQVAGWFVVWLTLMLGFRLLSRRRPAARRRAVYEIRNANGRGHFYIGSAYDINKRMRGHRSRSWWFGRAPLTFQATLRPDKVTWYKSAAEANRAEVALIRKHQPWANTRGTKHGRKRVGR